MTVRKMRGERVDCANYEGWGVGVGQLADCGEMIRGCVCVCVGGGGGSCNCEEKRRGLADWENDGGVTTEESWRWGLTVRKREEGADCGENDVGGGGGGGL